MAGLREREFYVSALSPVQALSLMWPELLEPIDGAVTPSSVRFRMTLRAGNGEAVVSVDDIARMDMKHLHATMFTHLRELHFLIRACAGACPRALPVRIA